MENRLLLDCTLRDGGYINDWDFGNDCIINIFERLIGANMDIIELCFIDERRVFDENRTIFPDTMSINKVFGHIEKNNTLVVGMIDYGTCPIEKIQDCKDCYLDGIRVIFKHPNMHGALEYCKQLIDKGYKVFVQATSITSYTKEQYFELISLVNQINPFAVSIVDTYGLLHADELLSILKIFDDNVNEKVSIGYHAHNNFQLGYSNCMAFLNYNTERTLSVDGSLYGMGKSAGNAPTELIAMFMNQTFDNAFAIPQLLEAIENSVMPFSTCSEWGYNLFYFVAAYHKCHPSYVSYIVNKQTLSSQSIGEILEQIDEDKKLFYNESYIEKLYLYYQSTLCNDDQAIIELKNKFEGKEILILGPGAKMISENNRISDFLNDNKPEIISINYIPTSYKIDYLFLTNSKRYSQLTSKIVADIKFEIIATSNLMRGCGNFDFKLNYGRLIDNDAIYPDNSLIMALKLFEDINVKKIYLAGFDGYSTSEATHFNTHMQYANIGEHAEYLNEYCKRHIRKIRENIDIEFVTTSLYGR